VTHRGPCQPHHAGFCGSVTCWGRSDAAQRGSRDGRSCWLPLEPFVPRSVTGRAAPLAWPVSPGLRPSPACQLRFSRVNNVTERCHVDATSPRTRPGPGSCPGPCVGLCVAGCAAELLRARPRVPPSVCLLPRRVSAQPLLQRAGRPQRRAAGAAGPLSPPAGTRGPPTPSIAAAGRGGAAGAPRASAPSPASAPRGAAGQLRTPANPLASDGGGVSEAVAGEEAPLPAPRGCRAALSGWADPPNGADAAWWQTDGCSAAITPYLCSRGGFADGWRGDVTARRRPGLLGCCLGGLRGRRRCGGTRVLAAPWAGRTPLRCFGVSASPGGEVEGVGAATAVGLVGGLGSGCCRGSPGSGGCQPWPAGRCLNLPGPASCPVLL